MKSVQELNTFPLLSRGLARLSLHVTPARGTPGAAGRVLMTHKLFRNRLFSSPERVLKEELLQELAPCLAGSR